MIRGLICQQPTPRSARICASHMRHYAIAHFNPDEARRIRGAVNLAVAVHSGQRRRSGGPVICHPLSVAAICCQIELPADAICAAVLHDVLEAAMECQASSYVSEDLLWGYYPHPLHVVAMVQDLTKPSFDDQDLTHQYDKIRLAAAIEAEQCVPLIKAADVAHNAENLNGLGEANASWRSSFLEKTRGPVRSWLWRILPSVSPLLRDRYVSLLQRIDVALSRAPDVLYAAAS